MLNFLQNIMPILISIEMFIAFIIYMGFHKWGSGIYYFAAALINICAIYMIKKWG